MNHRKANIGNPTQRCAKEGDRIETGHSGRPISEDIHVGRQEVPNAMQMYPKGVGCPVFYSILIECVFINKKTDKPNDE